MFFFGFHGIFCGVFRLCSDTLLHHRRRLSVPAYLILYASYYLRTFLLDVDIMGTIILKFNLYQVLSKS